MIYGAFGGVLRHLVVHRGVQGPKKRKDRIELGIFQDLVLGIGAGLVVVMSGHVSPVVLAVVGGFAGTGLLTSKALNLFGRQIVYTTINSNQAANRQGLDKILEEGGHVDSDDDDDGHS